MARITLQNPCSANFEAMPETEKGRYCQHCQKSILDFRKGTRAEFEQKITESKGEICGIMPTNWVKPNGPKVKVRGRTFARLRVFAIALLMVFGPDMLGIQGTSKAAIRQDLLTFFDGINLPESGPEKVLSGFIVDEFDGEPILGAEVRLILNGEILARQWVAEDGHFEFRVPEKVAAEKGIEIEVNFIGESFRFSPDFSSSVPVVIEVLADIELETVLITGFKRRSSVGVTLGGGGGKPIGGVPLAVRYMRLVNFTEAPSFMRGRFQQTIEDRLIMNNSELNMLEF